MLECFIYIIGIVRREILHEFIDNSLVVQEMICSANQSTINSCELCMPFIYLAGAFGKLNFNQICISIMTKCSPIHQ